MSNDQLACLTQPQRDRLEFVELRVRVIGGIRGHDLVERCGIQSAAETRDFCIKKGLSLAIYGVCNAVLAPGYRSPDQQRLEAESD